MKSHRLLVAATIAAVVLAGTGGCGLLQKKDNPPASQAAGPAGTAAPVPTVSSNLPDVCTLITDDQMSQFTGNKIVSHGPDKSTTGKDAIGCTWSDANNQVMSVDIGNATKAQFDNDANGNPSVTGVGDEAYSVAGQLLYVLDGNYQFSASGVAGSSGEPARVAAIKQAIQSLSGASASPSPSASS
ncbi:DUF3558 family protein [Fodinicola feengrottensis]|uniref:DUF3558 domain-containing protein n=1 Tax=Fodinicola feengrottensis TaxID=435914 RepID=A0ABN2IC28_9ACTN|nr:DUF3558 family protein [Fodinicola feengrottensis]